MKLSEWGPWEPWTINSAGERRRLRYQRPKQVIADTTSTTTELDPNIPFEPRDGEIPDDVYHKSPLNLQVRDAVDVTSREGDVVLQRTLVMRERETVTALLTEDNMMDMQGVRETWSVVVTTARSSDITTTRRMTAVRGRRRTDLFTIFLYI